MVFGPVERDDDSAEFFDGAARGEFMMHRCEACGRVWSPSESVCGDCGAALSTWVAASGDAELRSWTVLHQRPHGKDGEVVQKVVGIGELVEGPWWWAPVVGIDQAGLRDGLPLRVGFAAAGDDERLPVFEAR